MDFCQPRENRQAALFLYGSLARAGTGCERGRHRTPGHARISAQLSVWLDAVGTPIVVQQKLMRHADIRTTMNIYGDVVTDEMTTASERVAEMLFVGTERKQSAVKVVTH